MQTMNISKLLSNQSPVQLNRIFFVLMLIIFQAGSIVIFAFFIRYDDMIYGSTNVNLKDNINAEFNLKISYSFYQNIGLMMLVGYSFLIAFLRFNRWNSLGMTLYTVCLGMQYYIIFMIFWQCLFLNKWGKEETIDFPILLKSQKGVIAVLISLGALMGKIDYFQLLFLIVIELILYCLNEYLILNVFYTCDAGGGMMIHLFGGIFGASASWVYSPKFNCKNNPNKLPSYSSGTIAFIGTLFLWIFFPVFNSSATQIPLLITISATNTYLGLASSTLMAFTTSLFINRGKLNIEHILNAILAGGIILGSCSEIIYYPYISIILGGAAGIISVLCFYFLNPLLEAIYLYDTRGVIHLHAIPGFLSGVVSACICTAIGNYYPGNNQIIIKSILKNNRNQYQQGAFQIISTLVSLGIGLGGILVGFVLRLWRIFDLPEDTFGDHIFWKMMLDVNSPIIHIPGGNIIPHIPTRSLPPIISSPRMLNQQSAGMLNYPPYNILPGQTAR